MSELKRYDIKLVDYDTSYDFEKDYYAGGDHVCAYEALDVITVQKEKIEAKDAEIARLRGVLEKIASCKCQANLHDCGCVVCIAKQALR